MTQDRKVTHIEVFVGEVPEWYHDGLDPLLEEWITGAFGESQFDGASCEVSYSYDGRHELYAYDDDGNLVGQTPVNLDGAFEYARRGL